MNNKILAAVAAAVMVTSAIGVYLLTSGGNTGNDDNNGNGLSSDMFKDYRAEFGDSVSLGIMNGASSNTQARDSGAGGSDILGNGGPSGNQEQKNRLVGIDDEENISEIWFSKIGISDDGRPNVITQDDLKAQIDKLHITKDFIYFSVTTRALCSDCHMYHSDGYGNCYIYSANSSYSREQYDRSGYQSNAEVQSFLIDRQSKNVYSLANMVYIYYLDENLITGKTIIGYHDIYGYPIFSAISVYLLTVEDGQIKFTDMVPNKNINVVRGLMDKNGIIFIANDTVDAIANGVVMCRLQSYLGNNDFTKSSDGNVYKTKGKLKVFSAELMDWIDPDLSQHMSIRAGDEHIVTKNEKIYRFNWSSYFVWDNDRSIFSDSPQRVFFLDENAVCLNEGSLYAYITASADTDTVKVPIAENIQRMEFKRDKLMAYKELVDGTATYEVYFDLTGVPQLDLVSEVIYHMNIIIIKPLFGI